MARPPPRRQRKNPPVSDDVRNSGDGEHISKKRKVSPAKKNMKGRNHKKLKTSPMDSQQNNHVGTDNETADTIGNDSESNGLLDENVVKTRNKDGRRGNGGDHDADEKTPSILFLEEQVQIHEATLRAWRQRREEILVQKEATLAKKRELLELRANLIERQATLEAARSKHLVLQAELRESLAMSREKLKRLTMLETEGDPKEEEIPINPAADTETDESWACELSGEEGTTEARDNPRLPQNPETTTSPSNKSSQFPLLFDSYNDANELARYHNGTDLSRNHRSLSGFLPYLDATQVGDYLTLMLRETYALDQETGVGRENKERSLRRQLLQNTCLDVLLLAPPDQTKDGQDELECAASIDAYSDAREAFFDPSISLCPYELAGICADDLCPYQHTTKATKILARERLPLPSLPEPFLSIEWKAEPAQRAIQSTEESKTARNKMKDYRQNAERDGEHQEHLEGLPPLPQEAALANDGDLSGEEEDFIMLPPSSFPETKGNYNSNDASIDEIAKNGDVHSARDDEDMIKLPSLSSPNFDGNNNDGNKEDECASNGDYSSTEDLNDELQGGVISESASLTHEKICEHESSTTNPFWWGGKLPMYHQEGNAGEMLSKGGGKATLSILDILANTFGLVMHDDPKTVITQGGDTSSSAERRLEIKHKYDSDCKDPIDTEFHDEAEVLGRLLDASRLAIHGGLYNVSITLSRELSPAEEVSGGSLLKDELLKGFANLLRVQTEVSRFYDDAASSLSCFEVAFATQVGLSILSWSMATFGKAGGSETGKNPRDTSVLKTACEDCLKLLRSPGGGKSASPTFKPMNRSQWEDSLLDGYFSESKQGINPSGMKTFTIGDAATKVNELRALIAMAQLFPVTNCEEPLSEQGLEESLNHIWSAAKNCLKEHELGNKQDGSNGDSPLLLDPLHWEFQCLKVVILMGYTISGCLANFAHVALAPRPTKDDGKSDGMIGSKLSVSNVAAWILLDGAIARVLKEMRRLLAEFPLLDVVLAPLCACSVASASYLRNYSTAQNRLVEFLSGNPRRSGDKSGYPSTNLMSYSELLWSQLVQLRMSLPNESPAITNPSVLAGNFMPRNNVLLAKRDSTEEFSWQPSKALKEEIRQFVTKLRSLDIRLRHVVLWGDWMFSSSTENAGGSSQAMLRLFSNNDPIGSVPGHNSTEAPLEIIWRNDLMNLFRQRKKVVISTTGLVKQCFGSRIYPPAQPLPRLPLFLLHAGKFLTNLSLAECFLEKLPLVFGLYFPNLRVLDLSRNNLRELPESFRRLTHRMKFLEIFHASHNKLESLPSDTLSAASSKQSTLTSPALKVLDLSHNKLVSVPSLVGLDHLEVLELQCNCLVDMSVADWSRLALRLPSLRVLKREHQTQRDLASQEE